ncbi:hypothetical protein SNEBB_008055 [Seison nebaliae]|nr:hypothetical protein SNEBB_008055 [Seison nebaliae]
MSLSLQFSLSHANSTAIITTTTHQYQSSTEDRNNGRHTANETTIDSTTINQTTSKVENHSSTSTPIDSTNVLITTPKTRTQTTVRSTSILSILTTRTQTTNPITVSKETSTTSTNITVIVITNSTSTTTKRTTLPVVNSSSTPTVSRKVEETNSSNTDAIVGGISAALVLFVIIGVVIKVGHQRIAKVDKIGSATRVENAVGNNGKFRSNEIHRNVYPHQREGIMVYRPIPKPMWDVGPPKTPNVIMRPQLIRRQVESISSNRMDQQPPPNPPIKNNSNLPPRLANRPPPIYIPPHISNYRTSYQQSEV